MSDTEDKRMYYGAADSSQTKSWSLYPFSVARGRVQVNKTTYTSYVFIVQLGFGCVFTCQFVKTSE
jgi:hypothetical protein